MTFSAPRPASSADSAAREREWVARIRAGDEAAFEQLFEAYFAALCDFAQSYVRDPDAAEELVQNVFLRVWQIRAEWQPDGVTAYLFGACRNRALSQRRHERIVARFEDRAAHEGLPIASGQAPSDPDEDAQASELAEALRRAIHQLPERRRMVVILRWEHHLSHAEIAQVLGISVKTVETQFGRAIAVLRKRLAAFRP